jgi:metal-responsive CopG/Arc/MetJ family transcriptional regulator
MSPAGRPEVGTPINVRLGTDLLAEVDTYAKRLDTSRAEVIRRAVKQFLWDDEMTRMGNRPT